MDSLFNELRRRNVLRLAATYALVAWILIEAGSVLLPTFGVPDWFFRAYVLVIFAGFVVSLVLAWVFEVTPEGVKLESEIDRSQEPVLTKVKSNVIIIALLAIALGVSITFNVTGVRESNEIPLASAEQPSIAVLPFTSRSADPENRFFADGVHDDLLTRLADIESLRVISRTSVNEYRDTTKNLRDIGVELGVSTIVEGAVQRSGDQVRITVQLIDAASDEHIWASAYDRALTTENLFHIQSEISSQIALELRAALTPEEEVRLAVMPTKSIEALSYYTAARNNLNLRRFDTLQEARRQFEQAITIDPDYAQAHAGLAETVLVTLANHRSIEPSEAYEIASSEIERALQIDDQLAEAHAVKGLLNYTKWSSTRTGDGNVLAAESFQTAIRLNPNLSSSYVWFASLQEMQDNIEAAIDLLTKAMRIDPLGRIPYVNLPGFYAMRGEPEKALHLLVKAMDFFPDWPTPVTHMANHLHGLGRLDEAVAWSLIAQSMTEDPWSTGTAMGSYVEFGEIDKIRALAEQFPTDHPMFQMGRAFMHFTDSQYKEVINALKDLELTTKVEAKYAYPMISMSALMLSDYELAREYLLRSNPLLASDTTDSVDRMNFRAAILLAHIYTRTGKRKLADKLLAEATRVLQQLPRIAIGGYGISDVHILAIQGRHDAAIEAFRDAVDEGFVSLLSYEMWTIDQDVLIDDLRDDPRFEAMRLEIQEKIDIMRDNVRRADESGNWSELLGRTRGQLTASLSPN
jgi:TolB-like protein